MVFAGFVLPIKIFGGHSHSFLNFILHTVLKLQYRAQCVLYQLFLRPIQRIPPMQRSIWEKVTLISRKHC
jgi:hypothetical protein